MVAAPGSRQPKRQAPQQATAQAVFLYARVSTEDQAERQTVKAQLDFLRKYCDLHQLPVAGEYVDDGVSGTLSHKRSWWIEPGAWAVYVR